MICLTANLIRGGLVIVITYAMGFYPVACATWLIYLSLSMVVYLLSCRPYKLVSQGVFALGNELLYLVSVTCVFVLAYYDQTLMTNLN